MANPFVVNGQFVITTISRGNTEEQHTPTVTLRLSTEDSETTRKTRRLKFL